MNKHLTSLIVLTAFTMSPAQAKVLQDGLGYAWVRNAGGMKIGDATRLKNGVVTLPIEINYGTEERRLEQPTITSMAGNSIVHAQCIGKVIEVTVMIHWPRKIFKGNGPNPMKLGKIPGGKYKVVYVSGRERNEIGVVTVPD